MTNELAYAHKMIRIMANGLLDCAQWAQYIQDGKVPGTGQKTFYIGERPNLPGVICGCKARIEAGGKSFHDNAMQAGCGPKDESPITLKNIRTTMKYARALLVDPYHIVVPTETSNNDRKRKDEAHEYLDHVRFQIAYWVKQGVDKPLMLEGFCLPADVDNDNPLSDFLIHEDLMQYIAEQQFPILDVIDSMNQSASDCKSYCEWHTQQQKAPVVTEALTTGSRY